MFFNSFNKIQDSYYEIHEYAMKLHLYNYRNATLDTLNIIFPIFTVTNIYKFDEEIHL